MWSSATRYPSIDGMRGLAVVLMFLHHFPMYLMHDPQNSQFYGALYLISRFAAPLFLFIVGVSLVLSADKRMRSMSQKKTLLSLYGRGLYIIFAGFLLDALTYPLRPELNILHTIGILIFLLSPIAIKPGHKKCIAGIIVITLASTYVYVFPELKSAVDLFDTPPLPWAMYAAVGIYAGYFINEYRKKDSLKRIPDLFALAGLSCLILSLLLVLTGNNLHYGSHPSASFIALTTGISFYTAVGFFSIYRVYMKDPPIFKPFRVYGKHALTLYFMHKLVVITIPNALGLLNTFDEASTVLIMLAFVLLSWPLLKNRGFD